MYVRVKKLCKAEGCTIKELELNTNIGATVICRWRYNPNPKLDTLCKVADYFGVSLDYLVYGKLTHKKTVEK